MNGPDGSPPTTPPSAYDTAQSPPPDARGDMTTDPAKTIRDLFEQIFAPTHPIGTDGKTNNFADQLSQATIDRPERRRQFLDGVSDHTNPDILPAIQAGSDLAAFAYPQADNDSQGLATHLKGIFTACGLGKYVGIIDNIAAATGTRRSELVTQLLAELGKTVTNSQQLALFTEIDPTSPNLQSEVLAVLQARQESPQQSTLLAEAGLKLIEADNYVAGIGMIIRAHLNCQEAAEFPSWISARLLVTFSGVDLNTNSAARQALLRVREFSSAFLVGRWLYEEDIPFSNPSNDLERFLNLTFRAQQAETAMAAQRQETEKQERYRTELCHGYEQEFKEAYDVAHTATLKELTSPNQSLSDIPSTYCTALNRTATELTRSQSNNFSYDSFKGAAGGILLADQIINVPQSQAIAFNVLAGRGVSPLSQYSPVHSDHGGRSFSGHDSLSPEIAQSRRQLMALVEAFGIVMGSMNAALTVLTEPKRSGYNFAYSEESQRKAKAVLQQTLRVVARSYSDSTSLAANFVMSAFTNRGATTVTIMAPHLDAEVAGKVMTLPDVLTIAQAMAAASLVQPFSQKMTQASTLANKNGIDDPEVQQLANQARERRTTLDTTASEVDARVIAERHVEGQKQQELRQKKETASRKVKEVVESAQRVIDSITQLLEASAMTQAKYELLASYITSLPTLDALMSPLVQIRPNSSNVIDVIDKVTHHDANAVENSVMEDLRVELDREIAQLRGEAGMVVAKKKSSLFGTPSTSYSINLSAFDPLASSRSIDEIYYVTPLDRQVATSLQLPLADTSANQTTRRSELRLNGQNQRTGGASAPESLAQLKKQLAEISSVLTESEDVPLETRVQQLQAAEQPLATLTNKLSFVQTRLTNEVANNQQRYQEYISQAVKLFVYIHRKNVGLRSMLANQMR